MIPSVSLTVRPRQTPPALADLEADLDRPVSLERYELTRAVSGFLSASVTQSYNAFASNFSVAYSASADEVGQGLVIEAGDGATLEIDGEPWITGWVDADHHSYGAAKESREIRGRSLLGDLEDCTARVTGRPYRFSDITLQALIGKLAEEYSIDVIDEIGALDIFPRFEVKENESIAKAVRRACRARGVWTLDRGGQIVLTRAGLKTTATRLVGGRNVLSAKRARDFKQRFGQYRFEGAGAFRDLTDIKRVGGVEVEVRGQQGHDTRVLRADSIASEVEDQGVGRLRRLQVSTRRRTHTDISMRALLERQQRAGRSETYHVEVAGWQTDEGEMWSPGIRVHYADARLRVSAEFVIADVTHQLRMTRSAKFRTSLTLAPPQAFDVLQTLDVPRRGGTEVHDG